MNVKRLISLFVLVLFVGTVAVLAAPPSCPTAYCVRHNNGPEHGTSSEGTLFDSRNTGKSGFWLIWLDTDGQQTTITVTGYNIQSAWLPSRSDVANLVPNPDRLPDPSNFDVVATPGANIVITAKSGNLPKEFLLGIHGLDGTLWGVLGSTSVFPTQPPTAAPLPTPSPVPTAAPLPTIVPPTLPGPTPTP